VPAPPKKREKPGLKSVHELREQRVAGKYARPSEKLWLFSGLALASILIGYWYFASHKLEGQKGDLLAKRKAVVVTLGAEWYPLRDKIEKIVIAEAGGFQGDFVDPSARSLDFTHKTGIYLRLRVADAKDSTAIRKAAQDSLRDGFVGCLVVAPNPALARGDVDAGAFAENPWNLRQAYQATRILTDEWDQEVRESGDDLRLRVFQQQYDKAVDKEIPLAARIVKQAEFFLLVLDEDTDGAKAAADGGPITSEVLQTIAHPARVVVANLQKDGIVLRLRREPAAGFRFAGETAPSDPETLVAMQRQVNNCQLANEVKAAVATK
jgi:hypothetical protein